MRVAVIGLGNFGMTVAQLLHDRGHDVLVIDGKRELVQKAREFSSQAVALDCTKREMLERLGLRDVDVAIVSLGENLSASILVTLYLKEMQVKRIMVKAINEDHKRILELIGATDVIFPEREVALKVAASIDAPNILDYLPLPEGFQVVEWKPPESFVGKSLGELAMRREYGVQVIAVEEGDNHRVQLAVSPDYQVKGGDVFVILGRAEDIEKLKKPKKA